MARRDDLEARLTALLELGEFNQAATVAIEGYGPAVLGYLGTMLDEDEAQDAFSLFAEALWRGLPTFRGECTVRVWAFRLAWHCVSRVARDPYRCRRQRLATSAASRLGGSVASAHTSETSRAARLRHLEASLAPEDRALLVLRLDRELEWDEIAATLSTEGSPVTAPALRKRFERLKTRLAHLARAQGLVELEPEPEADPAGDAGDRDPDGA
jgi:RNA polymerase sigma-70 factor (ECF subfamily)